MEGEKKNAGWHRWQWSRKPQSFQEHSAKSGCENAEKETANSLNNPVREKYCIPQQRKDYDVPGSQIRTMGGVGTRGSVERLERDHGNLHCWENKSKHNDAEDEGTAEEGDEEDSELYTADDGDNEDDYTEGDTSNDEDDDRNQDLRIQILAFVAKLKELIKAQERSDNGKANESAGESISDGRRKNLKDQPTTGHNGPYAGKSSSKYFQCSSSASSTHDQIKCNGVFEENRLRGHLAEGTSARPRNTRENQRERLEIRFPIPRNLRSFDCLVNSTQKFELGTMGYPYHGGIADGKMHGYGRLMLNDRGDFIAGIWDGNRLMDLKSCQLVYGQETINIVRRLDDYLLTLYENHFVAVVMINSTDQLDFYKGIPQFKDSFFGKIITLEVLQDGLKTRRERSLQEFESFLRDVTAVPADPVLRASIFILLRTYSTKNSNFTLSDFLNDPYFPPALRDAAIDLQTRDAEYRSLYNSFAFLKEQIVPLDLSTELANIYKVSIQRYRDTLISGCPGSLPSLISVLQNLDDSKIAYATRADIDVFCQLVSQPFFQHYKECIENLAMRYGQALNKITPHSQPILPLMSPIFECLVRSLWEIISEIIDLAGEFTYERMLKCESGNWEIEQNIQPSKWAPKNQNYNARKHDDEHSSTSENKSLFYHRSLEVQYNLVLEMLEQIFPEDRIAIKSFDYKFRVLEQDQRESNWLQKGMQKFRRKCRGLPERFKDLSEERLVWLYMMDHTIHKVFKGEPKYQDVLRQYNPLLQGTVQFIRNSPTESHESFRALTHNIVKFVTSSAPYLQVTAEKHGVDVNLDNLGVDVDILFQHISTATQNIDRDPLAFSNFRDLITECNKFLRLRHFIQIKAAPGFFSAQLSQIMQTFMRIVETSLKKSVPVTALVVYFRYLNDFLHDFTNIDFLGMWYVKTMGDKWEYDKQAIENVENKLSLGKKCSYRVKNIEKFVAECDGADLSPPRHYIIEIVTELLRYIEKCLDKRWQSEDEELQLVQLKTTGVLLDAIRRSFIYLKEQPDYVDFEAFRKESVDPFARLVDECSTLNDLKNRTEVVKESFWYLRKMDEIDIYQALTLLKDLNLSTCHDADILLNCYNLYLSHYNKYIEKYSSVISGGDSHSDGIDVVKQMLKKVNHLHFSKWTKQFKTNEIPILLAGLSAVWSISVSKDLFSTGKFLKPHCIQILCILRLLSVGHPCSIDNHLAQVLTGQGKSVILGLLSSILALTGHKVRVLCYSAYLSSRDQVDFEDFFQTFGTNCNIVYGTFEGMANQFLEPTCDGRQKSLRQLVENRVRNHADWSAMGSVTTESKNTVLLIDEVDVFFTENFYGNSYCPCFLLQFRGLAVLQEKIWSLATKHYTKQGIIDHIKAFMDNGAATGNVLSDLNVFLSTQGTFPLLKDEDGDLTVKNYTNQSLFDEHILEMISAAVSVAATSDDHRDTLQFMINSVGLICLRSSGNIYNEEWSTNRYWGYRNTFNYFKLKGSNYDHKNLQNYGYLLLGTGDISYSLLPSQFPLILGVSGTIENLGEYEKTGIESYNIHNTTIVPSFYGESNLLFNKQTDFHYYTKEHEWLKKIYCRAVCIVQSNRAVLIFFESDLVIDLFTKEYRTKFDRVNEISANTQAHFRDKYIEEAGLPGAVTLATRVMGRGVDFKSSLSVEKHGGVHVIQTFFSTDIKEEIQIKGRTARKDNNGSFEIVICKKHLVKESIISAHDQTIHNYATFDEIRKILSAAKGRTVIDKIKQSEQAHKTTMKYFGLA